MKKQLFSKGIFVETLKQTAPYGVFVTLLYGIISFSTIISNQASSYELIAYDIGLSPLVPMLFASVITAVAFSFITSAKASDFYGAVSESKLCKLISTYLAVLFQCVVPIILVTGVSALCFGVLFSPERLYLSEHIILLTNVLSGCFLSSALTLMGLLLMGRFASGVIFALQCLYLPLMLVLFVGDLSVSGLQGATLDLTAFQPIPVWSVMNYKEMSVSLESLPVTLITGCVALLIAYLTLKKRGFEISRARTNGGIQTVFNALCAMPFALLASGVIEDMYSSYNRNSAVASTHIPRLYAFLILALFASVIADVVCSKSFKRIWRGALGTLISVGLVIAVLGVGIFIDRATDDMPIEVKSFKVTSATSGNVYVKMIPEKYSSGYNSLPGYVVKLKKLSFEDETGKVEKALNSGSASAAAGKTSLALSVTGAGGIKFNTRIYLSATDYAAIVDRIMRDESVMEKVLEIERPSSRIMIFANALKGGDTLTKKEQKSIYTSFYKEYEALSLEEKALVSGYSSGSFIQSFDLDAYNKGKKGNEKNASATTIIYAFRPCGPDGYLTQYRVYKQLMPETYNMIMEYAE